MDELQILQMLEGGDRRSVGRAAEVAELVRADPALVGALFAGMEGGDPLVRMRAADALEKATSSRPELLAGYAERLLSLMATQPQQEVAWHLAQLAGRLELTEAQQALLFELLESYLSHKSRIVRVHALEALTELAELNEKWLPPVWKLVNAGLESESPAVRARSRKLVRRLSRLLEGKEYNPIGP